MLSYIIEKKGRFMIPYEDRPYRPCVGIMLVNNEGNVFVGKRRGYVTIQVPATLRPGDSGKKILVIAHEQI